jgi:hypothetical protein
MHSSAFHRSDWENRKLPLVRSLISQRQHRIENDILDEAKDHGGGPDPHGTSQNRDTCERGLSDEFAASVAANPARSIEYELRW